MEVPIADGYVADSDGSTTGTGGAAPTTEGPAAAPDGPAVEAEGQSTAAKNKKDDLKEMTKKVVADKILKKSLEQYIEKTDRILLNVTVFNGKVEINASTKIARKLEGKPHLAAAIKELFDTEDENGGCGEGENKLVSSEDVELPKLFAPFKDKTRGWTKDNVRDQAALYLNILGYGRGGDKSLVETNFKNAVKGDFWPDSVNFKKYIHPSKASIEANEDVIESILEYYGYSTQTHCELPPPLEVNKAGRKSKKVSKETIIEEDSAVVDIEIEDVNDDDRRELKDSDWKTQIGSPPKKTEGLKKWIHFQKMKWGIQKEVKKNNSKEKQMTEEKAEPSTSKSEVKNSEKSLRTKRLSYMDEDSDGQDDVKNKTKKKRTEPMSAYERMREDRIKQRNQMAKSLGIHDFSKEFKKTKLP